MSAHSLSLGNADVSEADDSIVCWTRMHSEAGQALARIVERKEIERRAGGGLFFWGVGNPPPAAVPMLARMGRAIPAYFSIMKSKPKARDVRPSTVLVWRRFVDSHGILRDLPDHVLVTSRASSRPYHYALVCRSERPLSLGDFGPFNPSDWRNVGGAGASVGASQVTALLRRTAWSSDGDYRISMRADLVGGCWVKLLDYVELSAADSKLLDAALNEADWLSLVTRIRQTTKTDSGRERRRNIDQLGLFPT
jgi:hypothetical protein